ncbi:phosphatase PAP2 family protein [Streptomyces sp. NPDC058045]|uniref:phosphatase PAP2 family protein n=1 Tax=Streptomyces sp. NPDC058045 TaxID=3346311 RepID=UPI0036E77464
MRTERNLTRLDRVFARLDREPERPACLDAPHMSRHRLVLLGASLAFYLAIVYAVVTTSWLVRFDWEVMFFRPYQQWPSIHAFLDYYVVLGQRGPTAVMVAAWLGWRSWRQHSLRPLLALGTALLLLNVTVGAAKLGMGRLGPHYATVIGSNEMWRGGDIFPSGHTANAVVTWGILAYLASTPRARRYLSAISAVVALGVGLTTVYLGTHWLSDVVLGWVAGLLVLLALPWFEPLIARAEAWILDWREVLRRRRAAGPAPVGIPVRTPAATTPRATVPPLTGGATAETVLPDGVAAEVPLSEGALAESAAASRSEDPGAEVPVRAPLTPLRPARATLHSATPHPPRSERPPAAPAGSRRPPHADRVPHTASPARPLTGG